MDNEVAWNQMRHWSRKLWGRSAERSGGYVQPQQRSSNNLQTTGEKILVRDGPQKRVQKKLPSRARRLERENAIARNESPAMNKAGPPPLVLLTGSYPIHGHSKGVGFKTMRLSTVEKAPLH